MVYYAHLKLCVHCDFIAHSTWCVVHTYFLKCREMVTVMKFMATSLISQLETGILPAYSLDQDIKALLLCLAGKATAL